MNNGKWYLRGIVSSAIFNGYDCDTENYSVFTDVAAFNSWIKQHME
jgi:secreted trypsin-like serine protease